MPAGCSPPKSLSLGTRSQKPNLLVFEFVRSSDKHCTYSQFLIKVPPYNVIFVVVLNTVKPLFTYSVGQKCLYLLRKVFNRDMDFHRLIHINFNWSMTFPKIAKIRQALRLTSIVSSFHLHVKFTCFNFLPQIFGFFSSKHEITTREELSAQHSQRVGSYGQFQSWWTNSPKSPRASMGPLYFDICTPVSVMRT